MLKELTRSTTVYLVTGYSDLRKGIEGLAAVVQGSLLLNPFNNSLYLFCGRRRDRIKGLLWEGDVFFSSCTNAWTAVCSVGLGMKLKQDSLPSRRSAGFWRGWNWNSPKQSRNTSSEYCIKLPIYRWLRKYLQKIYRHFRSFMV